MSALDISFNQIAVAYDAQRAHPPEVSERVGLSVLEEVGATARILEVGVGTGRIALPVVAAGGWVTGIDQSHDMLEVARQRWHAQAPTSRGVLHLLQADALALPLTDRSFNAVLAVHVLHLLPDWRAGLAEIVRVLQPGGCFLQGSDWRDPASCVGKLRGQLRTVIMELLPGARPPGAGAAITQALTRLGGVTGEPYIVARWYKSLSPAAVIAGMAARNDPETWVLNDDLLTPALERLTQWAQQQWEHLDQEETVEHRFLLTVTRL